MELIENLLQLLTTFLGAVLSALHGKKSQTGVLLLLCFYGCFALGSLYWTLYLLLFHTTPRVFLCVGVRLGRQRDFSADFAGHSD